MNGNDTLISNNNRPGTGVRPVVNLNSFYRLHAGIRYRFVTGKPDTLGNENQHRLGLNYSITEKSFHPYYEAFFPDLTGKWNLLLTAGFDQVRRVNYYGLGNHTVRDPWNDRFNWLRTENLYASAGIDKPVGKKHQWGINALYDGIKVLDDSNRIVGRSKGFVEPSQYNRQHFLGGRAVYAFRALNQALLPTKGIEMNASAGYTANLTRPGRSFARFTAEMAFYIPLPKKFSVFNRSGWATVTGNPDFFQLNAIGGTNTVRGFQSFRFYGKTSFFNQSELRWIPWVQNKWYNGPFGLFGFFDQGRVWQPGETSQKMHHGYGGGVVITPLKNLSATAAFAVSREDRRFHFSVTRSL